MCQGGHCSQRLAYPKFDILEAKVRHGRTGYCSHVKLNDEKANHVSASVVKVVVSSDMGGGNLMCCIVLHLIWRT
jgi:hypothetical protein